MGKVELGIPEDDPRNPAVIADNVGDNVGDVAGMGADLFDSNVASITAALVIAAALDSSAGGMANASMVLCYAAAGLLASIIGVALARMGKRSGPTGALNQSTYITTAIFGVLTAAATWAFDFEWRIWGASAVGLLVGVVIGLATDYFTNDERKPVRNVANASSSGPAFTILSGVSYGFLSTLPAMAASRCPRWQPSSCALFGRRLRDVRYRWPPGMLSIVGMIISNDAYGPIVDNARGLVEMGGLGEEALKYPTRWTARATP